MTSAAEVRDAIRALRIELRVLNDIVAQRAGLNPRDLDILDLIDRDGPCSPSELAHGTGVRPATLTGVLRRLEDDGWIARTVDSADRRGALLTSTARFDELREIYAPVDHAMAELVGRWSGERATEYGAALTAIVEATHDGLRRIREDGQLDRSAH